MRSVCNSHRSPAQQSLQSTSLLSTDNYEIGIPISSPGDDLSSSPAGDHFGADLRRRIFQEPHRLADSTMCTLAFLSAQEPDLLE
jgi:hypothetical protein